MGQKGPVFPPKSPVFPPKSPALLQKNPTFPQKSPIFHEAKVRHLRKRIQFLRKRTTFYQKKHAVSNYFKRALQSVSPQKSPIFPQQSPLFKKWFDKIFFFFNKNLVKSIVYTCSDCVYIFLVQLYCVYLLWCPQKIVHLSFIGSVEDLFVENRTQYDYKGSLVLILCICYIILRVPLKMPQKNVHLSSYCVSFVSYCINSHSKCTQYDWKGTFVLILCICCIVLCAPFKMPQKKVHLSSYCVSFVSYCDKSHSICTHYD